MKIEEAVIRYQKDKTDSEAEKILYESGFKSAFFVAKTHVGDDDQSKDIAQETMIYLLKNIDKLESYSKYISWVKKAAKNRSIDYLRSSYAQKSATFTDVFYDADKEYDGEYNVEDEKLTGRPELVLDSQTKQKIVWDILDSLNEKERTVIILHFFDNLKIAEVADYLGLEKTKVQGRLQMAKNKIKDSVLAIQKRDDIKLYNLAPLPYFLWLLGQFEATEEVPYVDADIPGYKADFEALESDSITDGAMVNKSKIGATALKNGAPAGMSVVAKIGISGTLLLGAGGAVYAMSRSEPDPVDTPVLTAKKEEKKEDKEKAPEEVIIDDISSEEQETNPEIQEESQEESQDSEPSVEEVYTQPETVIPVEEPTPESPPELDPAPPTLLPLPGNAEIENVVWGYLGESYTVVEVFSVKEYGSLDAAISAYGNRSNELVAEGYSYVSDPVYFDRETGTISIIHMWQEGEIYRDGITYDDAYNSGILADAGLFLAY